MAENPLFAQFGRFQQPEAVLRAVIESPQRIVIFALDREYRYLAYNESHARTMKQIWGVQIGIGVNMLDVIGRDDDRQKARANFDRALTGESFTLIEEYGDARMNRRFYEDIYSPVRNEEGHIIGLTVYLTDITEQRRTEIELERYRSHLEDLVEQRTRELEAAHAQLLHAQKLESLGVLAGGIAHDFNNLLTIILARGELCLRDVPEGSQTRDHVSIIRDTALEARLLTRQLLNYAGKGKFNSEVLNLDGVVQSMAQLLRASINKAIQLELEPWNGPIAVQGDTAQLRQVVLNLVTNAAEAIGQEVGSIHVRTGIADVTPAMLEQACFPCDLESGRYAFLEVEDTGCGIDEEVRDKLFDPFFTTKFTGRGLGLAAVLGIVKSHHGTILLEGRLGQGTCFRVLLPVLEAVSVPPAQAANAHVEPFRSDGCALVVDDEEAVRAVTAESLRRLGYRVFEADGGASACRIFREHAQTIDIVLLDLAMPEMNGERTLRELKTIRNDVPVILLTAYAEDEFRMSFVEGDLAGILAKPFAYEELVDVLSRTLSRAP